VTQRPRVAVISLGGTIASAPDETGLAGPRLSAADLVAAVPSLEQLADVTFRDLARVPSSDLTFDLARTVAREVAAAVAGGASGVVLTQGTDTIEEMAYCLDLLVAEPVGLAVTGAMRHSGLPGADGGANLLDAVRTVVRPEARGLGCLVVLNEEVHAAAVVRKRHTSSPAAFVSPGVGPVGWIAEGVAHLRDRPFPRLTLRPVDGAPVPRVPLVRVTMDDDGWWLEAVRAARAPGLVLEALGGGHVPGWLSEEVVALATEIPVIMTSRTGGGEVLTRTYGGFPGSESTLVRGGVIPGGALAGLKARVLLTLLLASGADQTRIRDVLSTAAFPARVRPVQHAVDDTTITPRGA
jgi:L-asparaginase